MSPGEPPGRSAQGGVLESKRSSARRSGALRAAWRKPRPFRSSDGTELTSYAAGRTGGPTLVLCPGLGGGAAVWEPFVAHFGDRYRLLSWDYRGLYASGRPEDPRAYAMSHHVTDLVALLESERVERPVLAGWSMGVQLGLELHREHGERPAGLIAIHGTAGRPLATAFDTGAVEWVAPLVFGVLRQVGDRFGLVGPRLTRSPTVVRSFVRAGQALGFMSESIDVEAFRDIAEAWTRLDLGVYAEIFARLGDHDASELLASIETPTLVIAGGRDRFTPAHTAERMAERMPRAKLEVLPGATHFGLLEYPEPILRAVERFLEDLPLG